MISPDGKYIGSNVETSTWIKNLATGEEWEYNLIGSSYVNPDGLVLPEDPGESPVLPDIRDFMSDEEREKYDEAMQAYYDSGYNEELYPDAEDYMTDEQIDAYTDGKKVAIGATPGYALGINPDYPDYSLTMEFDLATGESRLFENTLNVAPTTILNDGTILAATPMGVCQQAYIKGAGTDTFMPLADYFNLSFP